MPDPQTVYRDGDSILMYVRTETRPESTVPEHLFVTTRERNVFSRWVQDVPISAELVLDLEGRKQANEAKWLLNAADHEREILLGLLKRACEWLPRERANELRKTYVESRP